MFISFTHPFYLFFLFVIPILVLFHFFGLKNIKGKALNFANFEDIAKIKGIDLYSKNIFLLIFNILFIVLLIFALAGLTFHKEVEASAFSFVIAIDNSGSMSATDILPDRLTAAKQTSIEFVDSLPFDSALSIISFAGESIIEQGLTKNKQEIKFAIENIELRSIGGTDIFEAISNSARILEPEKNKAVILLSDGQINIGTVDETIDFARANNLLIHTIGIGTVAGGEASYGLSKLDEDSLKSIAYNTNGRYFNVKNRQEIQESFNQAINATRQLGSIDLSFYLIIGVIILFIVKQFLLSINKIIW